MAGRPKGSKNLPKIRDYLNQDDIDKLVSLSYKNAIEKNDVQMQKFLLEQIFGKAPQVIKGDEDNPVTFGVIMYPNGKDNKKDKMETTPK